MSLDVIGSGFGRTGTRSLKEALEILGFSPCHHMEEVFANPEQVPQWEAIVNGDMTKLVDVFAPYRAQIDWPGAHVWRELAVAYPAAKVIHSTRPFDSWWKSYSATIGKLVTVYPKMTLPPHVRRMFDVMTKAIGEATFNSTPLDQAAARAAFEQRERDVRAAIPANRLLVYDVAEGWEPLCTFLGVPVPARPFPRLNTKDEFWAVVGGEPE